MMRIFQILVFGVTIFWHNLSAADAWRTDTGLLPPYCQARAKGLDSAEFARWRRTLGDVAVHIHHYCSGIYAEQKAKSTIDQRQRSRWLFSVIGEMRYVGKNCSAASCALYPELHSRWGWALAADGQPSEAISHFQMAIRAKPKYPPAYAKLSDVYVKINQPDEARRVLNEGLKAKPGSSMLKRRLKKLKTQ